ncbi:MAG TPA: histidine phosphatase family protein [Limnobacter sp.]|nr:histidine phosphatase family protein [Limnobacter sp.]
MWLKWISSWALVVSTLNASAQTQDRPLDILARPGVHAIMRHATAPGIGDPSNFTLGNCATQRNLNRDGVLESENLGQRFRSLRLEFTAVYSSQWCRCLDTARALNVGRVMELPALNSFFQNRDTRMAQTTALLSFVRSLKPSDKVLLVTHQVNITAFTGIVPSPGEVILFRLNEQGELEVLGRL